MIEPIKIAVAGIGKIATDQHLPRIAASPLFELAATISRHDPNLSVPTYSNVSDMLTAQPEIQAVSFCTPPQGRYDPVREVLMSGRHVMLEKPPGVTIGEVDCFARVAKREGVSLFTTWHSKYAPAVRPTRAWLENVTLKNVIVNWKEDVRQWHPGQDWIWELGGMGIFDPGVNALSLLTALFDKTIRVQKADLVFPENKDGPIAASLKMSVGKNVPVTAEFDWRHTGVQTWEIILESDQGTRRLAGGDASVSPDCEIGRLDLEYQDIYQIFAKLIQSGQSEVDKKPLRLVADCFMIGKRETTDPYFD
ncbi:Gfo/Idh/MocA family protein [Litorimonas sp. RW-G-Af-16]|uniref:Gfo/Idh/MocA family protein n=1 Tax=Litorimonas sp. RW-G-Af-16 TaxID=3241168 RepID=UPI00390CB9AC